MLTRRAALRVGGIGLFGLTLPQLLAAEKKSTRKAKAKAVIFLHQWGGPGQHETFDPKPDAPDGVRGWYPKPIQTVVPGLNICEMLPQVAKVLDQTTVIRCMQHSTKMNNHNSAGYYSLTGVPPPTDDQRLRDSRELFPAYGSVVSKLAPAPKGVATFVSFPHVIADGSITPGQNATFLGKSHNPLFVADDPNKDGFKLPELSLPEGVSAKRLESRTEILKLIDEQSDLLETSAVAKGVDESYQQAVALLTSPTFKDAFDLSKEKKETRERYGRTTYGQSCLLARRLVEAGAKWVNVYFAQEHRRGGQRVGLPRVQQGERAGSVEGVAAAHRPDAFDARHRFEGTRATGNDAAGVGGRVRPHAEDQRERRAGPLAGVLQRGAGGGGHQEGVRPRQERQAGGTADRRPRDAGRPGRHHVRRTGIGPPKPKSATPRTARFPSAAGRWWVNCSGDVPSRGAAFGCSLGRKPQDRGTHNTSPGGALGRIRAPLRGLLLVLYGSWGFRPRLHPNAAPRLWYLTPALRPVG